MKKIVVRVIAGIVLGLITWGVAVFIFSDGIGESFSAITSVEKVNVLMEIDQNGLLTVTETIDYVFNKAYRGVYRELPADRAGSLYSSIEVTAVGKEIKYIEPMGSESSRSVRVWFVLQFFERYPSQGRRESKRHLQIHYSKSRGDRH